MGGGECGEEESGDDPHGLFFAKNQQRINGFYKAVQAKRWIGVER